jgi:hypothetical protein
MFQGAELLQAVQDMSGDEEEGGKEEARTSNRRQPSSSSSSYPEPSNEEASTSSAQYTQVLGVGGFNTYRTVFTIFLEKSMVFCLEINSVSSVSFTLP